MSPDFDVSIVVPTYNERERLEDLVRAALASLAGAGLRGEIVIVDDNSPDGTGQIADRLAERDDVRAVHRAGKMGLGSAVMEGFKATRAPVLGVMDADLSHPPSLLPALLATLRSVPVDIAIASRYIPGGGCRNWPWRRRVLSRAGCLLARPLTPVRDVTSGFFLVRRDVLEQTSISAPGFKICLELLARSRATSVAEVPYVFTDRAAGQSKMTFAEGLQYFVQLRDLYLLHWRRPRSTPVKHVVLSEARLQQILQRPL